MDELYFLFRGLAHLGSWTPRCLGARCSLWNKRGSEYLDCVGAIAQAGVLCLSSTAALLAGTGLPGAGHGRCIRCGQCSTWMWNILRYLVRSFVTLDGYREIGRYVCTVWEPVQSRPDVSAFFWNQGAETAEQTKLHAENLREHAARHRQHRVAPTLSEATATISKKLGDKARWSSAAFGRLGKNPR